MIGAGDGNGVRRASALNLAVSAHLNKLAANSEVAGVAVRRFDTHRACFRTSGVSPIAQPNTKGPK